ncbi:MAG: hypothetical protein FD152_1063 [Xanthobacteraceae bacterium]|nr:MAG: hypothetical protein FD152_1063 [Xanthobacteraceae bacterium]
MTLGDGRLDRDDPLQRQGTVHLDRDLRQRVCADLAQPDAVKLDHAGNGRDRLGDRLGRALWRPVHQRVDGAAAELPAHDADQDGDNDGRDGVGLGKAEPDEEQARQNHGRTRHVGGEVQGTRLERVASGLLGDAPHHPDAPVVDGDDADHQSGHDGRHLDGVAAAHEAPRRLGDDDARDEEQEGRLGEGRDRFDLAVAVLVVVVGRLVGKAHRIEGQKGRRSVDEAVRGLRQDRDGAAGKAHPALGCGEQHRHRDGSQRRLLLDGDHGRRSSAVD